MSRRYPRPRYDNPMPHSTGARPSESFGSAGSPYGDGLARRNGTIATRDAYSLRGVSGAAQAPMHRGSATKVFTLVGGMDNVAQDCKCNGLRKTFAVGGSLQDELVASNVHRAAEDIEAIVRAGVDVPPWAARKLARAELELADIRTILGARLRLGQGGKLTLEEAREFQAAAIRQGLVRRSKSKRSRKRGIGTLLIGACCGAVDSVLSIGSRKKRKR